MSKLKTFLTAAEHGALGDQTVKLSEVYTQNGTGFILNPEVVNGIRVTDDSSVRQALEAERATVAELKKKTKILGDRDEAWLEKAEAAMKRVEKLGDDPAIKDQLRAAQEAIKAEMEKAHRETLQKLETKMKQREEQIHELLVDADALREMGKKDTRVEHPELLLPHVRQRIRVSENSEGRLESYVVGDDGKTPRVTRLEGKTGNMSIAELVADMKNNPVYAPAFVGSGAAGSGGLRDASGGGGSNAGEHTLSYEDAQNPTVYQAAAAAARKAGTTLKVAAPQQ